jgi:hypothetical protein
MVSSTLLDLTGLYRGAVGWIGWEIWAIASIGEWMAVADCELPVLKMITMTKTLQRCNNWTCKWQDVCNKWYFEMPTTSWLTIRGDRAHAPSSRFSSHETLSILRSTTSGVLQATLSITSQEGPALYYRILTAGAATSAITPPHGRSRAVVVMACAAVAQSLRLLSSTLLSTTL